MSGHDDAITMVMVRGHPSVTLAASRAAFFTGNTKLRCSALGNNDVDHVNDPVPAVTFTESKPPRVGARSSISSAMSKGRVTKCHAGRDGQRHRTAVNVNLMRGE